MNNSTIHISSDSHGHRRLGRAGHGGASRSLSPAAVPLVTFDPYLSIWSEADHLTDRNTQHWTHREHAWPAWCALTARPTVDGGGTGGGAGPFRKCR